MPPTETIRYPPTRKRHMAIHELKESLLRLIGDIPAPHFASAAAAPPVSSESASVCWGTGRHGGSGRWLWPGLKHTMQWS